MKDFFFVGKQPDKIEGRLLAALPICLQNSKARLVLQSTKGTSVDQLGKKLSAYLVGVNLGKIPSLTINA